MSNQRSIESWASKSDNDDVQSWYRIWNENSCCYYDQGAEAFDLLASQYEWETGEHGKKLNKLPYGDE